MNFDKAFEIVVGVEGGYVNDPNDPGGETKYGISKRSYPQLDIKNLTLDQAKAIYKQDYWDRVKGDDLTWPCNYLMFDFAVTSGVHQAIVTLQKTVKTDIDGVIGQKTIQLANNMGEEGLALFLADRAIFLMSNLNFKIYGRGWLKRLFLIAKK
jgi:lysozyme family protein